MFVVLSLIFLLFIWIWVLNKLIIIKWTSPIIKRHLQNYKAPTQLNYLYSFGSLALFTLALQIASGIFLALRYINSTEKAFDSVQFIIRTTNFGYIFQAIHSTGASLFLVVLFLHLLKGLWYKLYKEEHTYIWISGVVILVLVMMAAFTGYILPWGQMSYWAATVIFNFFSIVPLVGPKVVTLLFGGEIVGQATLSRVYVIHFLVPFIILILVFIHIMFLHKKGSTITYYSANLSVSLKKFLIKDLGVFTLLLITFILIIYVFPNLFVDFLNLEKADSMVTPKHIKPEWYFMPFYGILKTIPHKAGGILCMGLSIVIFLLVPFIYRLKIKSIGKLRWLINQLSLNIFLKKQIKVINYKFRISDFNSYNFFTLSYYKLNQINSLFLRRIYFVIFFCLLVSLGFFNDLPLGPYYIIFYFLIIILIV